MMKKKLALVLSGGGARGAYQAGVVRALYEISKDVGHLDLFRVVTGVSAGSINAAFLAAHADDIDSATNRLCDLWRKLKADEVFRTDYSAVTKGALKLMRGVSLGGFSEKMRPIATGLLNTEPLRQTLSEAIPFAKISSHIQSGSLDAVGLTATDYSTSMGISFIQGHSQVRTWKSANRVSQLAALTVDHVMASSAIPLFFPPVQVEGRAFGDGCLRNTAPLSPAVHLGAEKLVVIGVRRSHDVDMQNAPNLAPSLGRILSVLIAAIFMDAVEVDLERLKIINQTIEQLKKAGAESPYRPVQALYIVPSEGLSDIAQTRNHDLPKIIRFLLAGLGTAEEAAEILSYLLFEPGYCGSLVDLGYKDTMLRRPEVVQFLSSP